MLVRRRFYMFSSRRVMAPTVSASSGSFSSPTLMLGTKISHATVATLRRRFIFGFRFLMMWLHLPDLFAKVSAFWNFSFSRFCLRNAVSLNQTYLTLPVSLSFHLATYILLGSQVTFQPSGLGASGERFNVMSSWLGPSFHLPRCGWSPRPAKRHVGSAVQLATSKRWPSTSA